MPKQSKEEIEKLANPTQSFVETVDVSDDTTILPLDESNVIFPGDEPEETVMEQLKKKPLSEKAEEILGEESKEQPTEGKPAEKTTAKEKEEEAIEDLDETSVILPLFDVGAERYEWQLDDEKKPQTADEFWDFIEEVVTTSSIPQYASDESREFDEFVRNGGDAKKFMEIYNRRIDLDNISLEEERNQEDILTEYYKEKKFTDQKIAKLIHTAKQTDTIAEDAKDALDELKEINKQRKAETLKIQQQNKETQEQNTRQFVSDIRTGLKKVDTLFGINLTLKDKEQLLPYVFDVGKDGKTQQQRDFENDPVLYTILTSYAYMNREKLLKQIEDKGYSNATLKYKQRLAEIANKKKTQPDKQAPDRDESDDMLNMV